MANEFNTPLSLESSAIPKSLYLEMVTSLRVAYGGHCCLSITCPPHPPLMIETIVFSKDTASQNKDYVSYFP